MSRPPTTRRRRPSCASNRAAKRSAGPASKSAANSATAIWRMFWETAVHGRAVADVAAEAGRTAGAVYMARFRVMQRLKEKVEEATIAFQQERAADRRG